MPTQEEVNIHIVLYAPQIPPNTGNIARLCAATGIPLHLIEPLGFSLEDRYLKRAGLDYWPSVKLKVWSTFDQYLQEDGKNKRIVCTSARAGDPLQKFTFTKNDSLVFGAEGTGLPQELFDKYPLRMRIPTMNTVRSLNLSTSAGIVLYQALISTNSLEDWG